MVLLLIMSSVSKSVYHTDTLHLNIPFLQTRLQSHFIALEPTPVYQADTIVLNMAVFIAGLPLQSDFIALECHSIHATFHLVCTVCDAVVSGGSWEGGLGVPSNCLPC